MTSFTVNFLTTTTEIEKWNNIVFFDGVACVVDIKIIIIIIILQSKFRLTTKVENTE